MELFNFNQVGDFLSESDQRGGPGTEECNAYWANVSFDKGEFHSMPDDPFGSDYVTKQIKLYELISGRSLDQTINEHTDFNLKAHVAAANPYANVPPAGMALHMARLSTALNKAALPAGGKLLDMGCGWGLSSEIAAYLGLDVTAVDINPDFINLVRQRAELGKRRIKTALSTFDDYTPDIEYDGILFYECFHHAVRPWEVLQKLEKGLVDSGQFILVGEPFNEAWEHWGLRLDPLSIYCIAKFGWFESGWSQKFVRTMFERMNFRAEFHDGVPLAGEQPILIATKIKKTFFSADDLFAKGIVDGLKREPDLLLLTGKGYLGLPETPYDTNRFLLVHNHATRSLSLTVRSECRDVQLDIPSGPSQIALQSGERQLWLDGQTWSPAAEFGSEDNRTLSIHIEGMLEYPSTNSS